MKNRFKKISSLLFLITALMPVTFTLFFLYRQQLVRHEMKEKLEGELLHTIIVPEANVQWVKYKKEIRIDGKMFDIKSFTVENGKYIFTGLYDEEETALNNYFERNTKQKKEAGNEVLSSLFKMLQSVYNGDADDVFVSAHNPTSYSPLILQHISSPFKNILTPPPQPMITYQE